MDEARIGVALFIALVVVLVVLGSWLICRALAEGLRLQKKLFSYICRELRARWQR